MTGIPKFNFPAFTDAARTLRAEGFDIISPAEMDSDAVKAAAATSADGSLDANGKIAGETWGEMLARDVRVIADQADGIVFLPDWHKSRGARLEAFVALLSGKKTFGYFVAGAYGASFRPILADVVRTIIKENMP